MNMYVVVYEGLAVLELGCVGGDFYGPFASENEAQEFIALDEAVREDDATATIIEVEAP
jgi:hypothetical protein